MERLGVEMVWEIGHRTGPEHGVDLGCDLKLFVSIYLYRYIYIIGRIFPEGPAE